MKYNINKAAVIGAGVMGTSIAAHFIGSGIPVLVMDIVPKTLTEEEEAKGLTLEDKAVRDRIALSAKKRFTDMKAGYCYSKSMADYMEVGNMEDDLDRLKECDIVIEAVLEKLEVKQSVFAKVSQHVRKDTILASNTSGLLINKIAEGIPEEWRKNFIGMHFYNPVRYMKLVEIIPGDATDPELVKDLKEFSINRIGKDVVIAKDEINFIGSRLGSVSSVSALRLGEEMGFTVPEIDAMTGTIVARPKAGACRLLDLVGIDIFEHVTANMRENTENAYEKDCNTPPKFADEMVARGQIGDKAGYGFYKVEKKDGKKQKYYYDFRTGEFVEFKKTANPVLDELLKEKNPAKRLEAAVYGDSKENLFMWKLIRDMLLYTARNQEEMAHSVPEVDLAMRSGYNWMIGPYQVWDAIGVRKSVERMEKDGCEVPAWVKARLDEGKETFYSKDDKVNDFIDIHSDEYEVVYKNNGGVLRDIGDGVLNLEFTTPACSLNDDLTEALIASVDIMEDNGKYKGLVLGHNKKNFCVGGQLEMLIDNIKNGNFDKMEKTSRYFQQAVMRIKYAKKPVISCIRGKALGGGAEIALHSYRRVMHVECVMAFPEPRIGLLPAGGGTKEMVIATNRGVEDERTGGRVNSLRKTFNMMSSGKFCSNAYEAIENNFGDDRDIIVMNEDALIDVAKKEILHLNEIGFRPRVKRDIKVTGTSGLGALKYMIIFNHSSHIFTEYDTTVFTEIAKVLSGGEVVPDAVVKEEWLLELEIRGFMKLCHEPKTLERLVAMAETKKPLHN